MLPEDVSIEKLKERFSVSVKRLSSGGEFLLTASINGTDPQRLSDIAQAWTGAFTESYGELFQDRTARSFSYISENYSSTESELEDLIGERAALLEESSIEVLKAETEALRGTLASNHRRLLESQQELGTVEAYLTARGQDPMQELPTYVLTSSVDPNTLAGALAFGLSPEQYRAVIDAEVLDLGESISRISRELALKQQQVDIAETRLAEIDRRIDLVESEHAYLASKLQEAKIALAESPDPIQIIDEPLVPESPIAPKKATNIAVAGFLGLMVGTLLAFFVDYLARVQTQERTASQSTGPHIPQDDQSGGEQRMNAEED